LERRRRVQRGEVGCADHIGGVRTPASIRWSTTISVAAVAVIHATAPALALAPM
jgi:hypothetical protein